MVLLLSFLEATFFFPNAFIIRSKMSKYKTKHAKTKPSLGAAFASASGKRKKKD
jgi:hypothetical protein